MYILLLYYHQPCQIGPGLFVESLRVLLDHVPEARFVDVTWHWFGFEHGGSSANGSGFQIDVLILSTLLSVPISAVLVMMIVLLGRPEHLHHQSTLSRLTLFPRKKKQFVFQ